MDDTQLIEADLVVDDENLLIKTEIQNLDDIAVDNDSEEDFVATLGKESVAGVPSKRFCNLLKTVQWNVLVGIFFDTDFYVDIYFVF
nr:hypothetical protein [Tanacetum cinerariifolium]